MEEVQYMLLKILSSMFLMQTCKVTYSPMGTLTVTLALSVIWRLKSPLWFLRLKAYSWKDCHDISLLVSWGVQARGLVRGALRG